MVRCSCSFGCIIKLEALSTVIIIIIIIIIIDNNKRKRESGGGSSFQFLQNFISNFACYNFSDLINKKEIAE